MRARLSLVGLLGLAVASSAAGCKWTDFDDLEKETWVRSTQDPDLGSSDYAVAIAGVTQASSGGTLAVISDDSPNYSTIDYNSAGSADVGANPIKLGTQNIGAIQETPALATDANGRIGLVEKSITGGNFAVLFGSPTAPAGIEFASAEIPTPAPAGAVFVGDTFVFAAGTTAYSLAATGGTPVACTLSDNMDMPVQIAGLGASDTKLLVWTKAGVLFAYDLTMLSPCGSGKIAPLAGSFSDSSFLPTDGAHVLVSGGFALLAGRESGSRNAQVYVIDLGTFAEASGQMPVPIEGLQSAILADFGGATYFVAGIPDKQVDKISAGDAELFEFNATTGALAATPTEKLHDADPESGQEFGRWLTTMQFNGNQILVVATKGEVFAYYRTSLYDHLP